MVTPAIKIKELHADIEAAAELYDLALAQGEETLIASMARSLLAISKALALLLETQEAATETGREGR